MKDKAKRLAVAWSKVAKDVNAIIAEYQLETGRTITVEHACVILDRRREARFEGESFEDYSEHIGKGEREDNDP